MSALKGHLLGCLLIILTRTRVKFTELSYLDKRYRDMSDAELIKVFVGERVKTINSGVIDFFLVNNVRYAVISHWPDQIESGAIFQIQGPAKAAMRAIINNGYISCR